MKKGIHPEYSEVAFVDLSINQTFIIRSAAQTRIVEAGRVEKFRAKFAAKQQAMNAAAEAAKAAK